MMLARLSIHYWRPSFTEGQAKLLIQDMVDDLCSYRLAEVENAIRDYRRSKEKYFPRSGQLIALIPERKPEPVIREFPPGYIPDPPKPPRIVEFGESRPCRWWDKPRPEWKSHWLESEVPAGERIRDSRGGKWRAPV